MNKQRKVVITTTYNEMGIIIDTKAEEISQTDLQSNSQPTCNQLATDCISRQAAIDAVNKYFKMIRLNPEILVDSLITLPSAQPGWIPCDRELPKPNEEDGNGFHKAYLVQNGRWMDVARWDGKHWIAWGYSTALLNVVAWCELPKPWEGKEQ